MLLQPTTPYAPSLLSLLHLGTALLLVSSAVSLGSSGLAPGESPTCENPELCSTGAGSIRRALSTSDDESGLCELYLAESSVNPGYLGLFTGVKVSKGNRVGQTEIVIPILDAKKNEWSQWHDLVEPATSIPKALLESYFVNDVFVPGILPMAACSTKYHNIEPDLESYRVDNAGVHRNKDPSSGSFSYYHNAAVNATKELLAGEELVLPCTESSDQETQDSSRKVLSVEFLQGEGICLDNLRVDSSTIPGAGRGAFAKRAIPVGQVIAPSPVVHFDLSQMEIVEQSLYEENPYFLPMHRDHGIRYTEHVTGQQLLLNYAFGDPDSHVVLLPYAPMVNLINHNDHDKANAYVRWSYDPKLSLGSDAQKLKSLRPMELFANTDTLMIEYVALRDIQPGEEIFVEYGDAWVRAWNRHAQQWKREGRLGNEDYVSAADWMSTHAGEPIRTVAEQTQNPYPRNLKTACFVSTVDFEIEEPIEEGDIIEWTPEMSRKSCPRPCSITKRIDIDGSITYDAVVFPMDRFQEPEVCGSIPEAGVKVEDIAASAVILVDQSYSSDVHQSGVFRHTIGVPEYFYPDVWDHADPNPAGDFIPTPLAPGQMDRIHWKDTGEIVLDNCYRLGLTSSIRETLLEYCRRMGIIDLFRHLTVEDNGLLPGKDTHLKLKGYNWFIQRPEKMWYSNLHWLSPADNRAHEHYLQALSIAGFDDMLKSVGEFLGLDSLVVFHVTFIAVSQSTRGYIHTDVSNTGNRTFNVIVPLMKAENSPPELDIQEDGGDWRMGRYPYEIDVAVLNGTNEFAPLPPCRVACVCVGIPYANNRLESRLWTSLCSFTHACSTLRTCIVTFLFFHRR